MTIEELLKWAQTQPLDAEVQVYKGPVVGWSYLDDEDVRAVGEYDENLDDGIHPMLKKSFYDGTNL